MKSLKISKIEATGNDFLFIDARAGGMDANDRPRAAARLCDRHFAIGADGLIFVENSKQGGALKWDFYNSDGSTAEMCGNASRCFAVWWQRTSGRSSLAFEAVPGTVRTEIAANLVQARLDYVKVDFHELIYVVGGVESVATLVNTGVPHAVITVDDIEQTRHKPELIRALRFHPKAGAKGANVTLLQVMDRDRGSFETVTFERGVENFTLSCGTGVLAAGAVAMKESGPGRAILKAPGGKLGVEFGKDWKGALLEGPANFIFETEISGEFLR